jgi:hypothetical protein
MPHLIVFEISNNGSRPIRATDFESPIEIVTPDNIKIARAEVTDTVPGDLQPELGRSDNVLKLKPLLLNPKDSIRVALVTSGGPPEFSLRARIEGISSITQEDSTTVKNTSGLSWTQALIAFALMINYGVGVIGFMDPRAALKRRTFILIAMSSLFGSIIIFARISVDFNISSSQAKYVVMFGIVIAIFLAYLINREPKNKV